MSIDPPLIDLLRQMADWCTDAAEMAGSSRDGFIHDRKSQYATSKCVEEIGETANRILQRYPAFFTTHPELPLAEAYRMRNRLSHHYDGISLDVLWDTAIRDAPDLAARIEAILADVKPT